MDNNNNNIKKDINFILNIFQQICNKYGNEMPENFYETQMKKQIPEIKKQPSFVILDIFHKKIRPDAVFKNICIEYKITKDIEYNKRKNRYQCSQYLRVGFPVVLLLNFCTQKHEIFY